MFEITNPLKSVGRRPRAVAATEADNPQSPVLRLPEDQPLALDSGAVLAPLQIAYQTYGKLNAERSNAILICHALTGDQHVANAHPVTGKKGWWSAMVPPRCAPPAPVRSRRSICPR